MCGRHKEQKAEVPLKLEVWAWAGAGAGAGTMYIYSKVWLTAVTLVVSWFGLALPPQVSKTGKRSGTAVSDIKQAEQVCDSVGRTKEAAALETSRGPWFGGGVKGEGGLQELGSCELGSVVGARPGLAVKGNHLFED